GSRRSAYPRRPFWGAMPEDRRNSRAVAVTPEHRPLDRKRIQEFLGLDRGGEMEFRRQLGDVWRPAVPGAIGDDKTAFQLCDGVVMRVEGIAPTTVEEDDRRAPPDIPVAELDRSLTR